MGFADGDRRIHRKAHVPQRIRRPNCGSVRTRVTRRGWRPTPASTRCCRPCGDDPEGQLGAAVRNRFGDTLPFLMKVLAADEPLSLQAHPSAEQAVEGFAREDRLGIPVSSPIRNYRDRSHKPELLVALETFEALAGFRPAPRTVELMRALAVSDLDPFVGLLAGQPDADGLRALFTTWITAPQPDLDVLVPAVIDGAIHYVRSGEQGIRGRSQDRARTRGAISRRRRCAGRAAVEPVDPAARRGDLSARGQSAHLPAWRRHRGDGQLRQRVARWFDARNTSTCPSCCGCWISRLRSEAALRPKTIEDGMELVYDTPAPEFSVSVLGSTGTGSATRWMRRRATTARRSCCAQRVRRWCTPNPAR